MKWKSFVLLVVLCSALPFISCGKEFSCLLRGRIINRTSKAVLLMKATADPRSALSVRIPITGDMFVYKLAASEQEAYLLIFEEELEVSVFKPVVFFPDTTEIRMALYSSSEAEIKNEIDGGALNRAYQQHMTALAQAFKSPYLALRQKRNEAIASKTYYSSAYNSLTLLVQDAATGQRQVLLKELDSLRNNGSDLSPVGKAIRENEQRIVRQMFAMRYDYISRNPGPVSYYMLYEDLAFNSDAPGIGNLASKVYELLAKAMPSHPYTQRLGFLVKALALKPGQPLIDFDAPDPGGKDYRFSSVAGGKIVLLDLWASWCGPCIAKTREIMPIYERFKGKGFEVVGVAREFKNLDNLEIALAREKHPWLTLVDLEDKHLVWNKYGLNNSGGGMVLFDRAGKILALNPTAKELEKILSTTLE
jgi:thiol-disulfide isomerase/thioredoxin